ncbi:MAG: DUF5043 domain-containing protein [Tidjanibacter sp.]|nr:DUF5043 domain-containing protein [Alistipes sp.]MBR3682442.1 DUF5043 domain-containing protein [Tidjanibacter sp.]MBR3854510.1 DUF5043 domain-containing protein [Tidjanibacter sp.]
MKRFLFTTLLLVNVFSLVAQRNYERHTPSDYKSDTLHMADYTYVADTLGAYHVLLHNITNHIGRGEIAYKDGSPLNLEHPWELPDFVVMTDAVADYMYRAVDDAFSVQQADSLEGKKMSIVLNISSTNGYVTDVYFKFPSFYYYTKIPVSVFREIEVKLKQLVFELTDEGRRLTYCHLSWTQCPTGYVAPTLDPDVPFDGGSGGEGNVQTGPRGSIITEPMVLPK